MPNDGDLAALITLLEPTTFPFEDYAAALERSGGDIGRAAEMLLLGEGSSRKETRLNDWFRPAKRAREDGGSKRTESTSQTTDRTDRAASASQWANLLKPQVAVKPLPQRVPPIHLGTPEAIAASGLPLVVLDSPLSPTMAAALYHEMMAESPKWPKNKWYLAGRQVESNHQSTGYHQPRGNYGRDVGVPYFYSSRKFETNPYTPVLSQAAKMVEDAVNAYLESKPRYAWEYRGRWRANMCAANRYDGAAATVGWHADQMTYLGPYPTIASLSLGTPRAFRLRPIEAVNGTSSLPVRTYEVTLKNNSLCLMTPGCQEHFKHTVPPQKALDTFRPGWDEDGNPVEPGEAKTYTSRINITFRFYREDFHPAPAVGPYGPRSGTPTCHCGIPTLLRADQKAKARSRLASSSTGGHITKTGIKVLEDDMLFFWQCQSPGATGDMKGCGFFKILDMKGEGRGPCIGYEDDGVEEEIVEWDGTSRGDDDAVDTAVNVKEENPSVGNADV